MSDVFHAGGAVCKVRASSKPKRVHRADRLDWWRGYEDGWAGHPVASVEPWYADGHNEGSAAVGRRREILLEKNRTESKRDAAPELMRRLEKAVRSGEVRA